MMNQKIAIPENQTITTELAGRTKRYLNASMAHNTQIMYANSWAHFEVFCTEHGYRSLPADITTLVDYITHLADDGRAVSSIQVYLAAISWQHDGAHVSNPVKSPEVKQTMKGIRRTLGIASKQKAPITFDDLHRIVSAMPDSLRGLRDKSIILLGFAGAFRRSELTGLRVEDVRINGIKATITLRRSKTDQEGAGMVKVIPVLEDRTICPVNAMREWMDTAQIHSDTVFRSIDKWGHVHPGAMQGREVARIVKRAAYQAGLEPRQLAGHSLRAGYVTTCMARGVPTWAIRQQTGHKSERVFEQYIRNEGLGTMDATRAAFGEAGRGNTTGTR